MSTDYKSFNEILEYTNNDDNNEHYISYNVETRIFRININGLTIKTHVSQIAIDLYNNDGDEFKWYVCLYCATQQIKSSNDLPSYMIDIFDGKSSFEQLIEKINKKYNYTLNNVYIKDGMLLYNNIFLLTETCIVKYEMFYYMFKNGLRLDGVFYGIIKTILQYGDELFDIVRFIIYNDKELRSKHHKDVRMQKFRDNLIKILMKVNYDITNNLVNTIKIIHEELVTDEYRKNVSKQVMKGLCLDIPIVIIGLIGEYIV